MTIRPACLTLYDSSGSATSTSTVKRPALELSPDHFVHHADVALDDADDFGGDVFVDIVGDGDARETIADEGDGDVNALQKALGVNAAEDEATLVEGFGALGGGADADGGERVADAGEE